ncbi:MAG: AIR synthase-related protein [Acidimicrobiales bacterium]|nr:AIR synthase-related protein [Acidimicrobiales bacterium]
MIDISPGAYLVAATDPVTFATDRLGWYLVHVNANDIAVMGGTPRWLMATVLLPEGTEEDTVGSVFDQILKACDSLGVTLIGGHTEVSLGLDRPIGIGAMLGEVAKGREIRASAVELGDAIVLTRSAAIEGTAILASEAHDALTAAGIEDTVISRSQHFLDDPGISVVKDAAVATSVVPVHAMHDPTEGGIATALRELADASGTGLLIEAAAIPYAEETIALSTALGIDPFGLIASGALLITVAPTDAPRLIDTLDQKDIPAALIGQATDVGEGLKLRTETGQLIDLPYFERDEIARYLGG